MMTRPWHEIAARYEDYKGDHRSIRALGALAQRISDCAGLMRPDGRSSILMTASGVAEWPWHSVGTVLRQAGVVPSLSG